MIKLEKLFARIKTSNINYTHSIYKCMWELNGECVVEFILNASWGTSVDVALIGVNKADRLRGHLLLVNSRRNYY